MIKWLMIAGVSGLGVASSLAVAPTRTSPPPQQTSALGPMCRRAPALEQLGAEAAPQQQQRTDYRRRKDMAYPPPPPVMSPAVPMTTGAVVAGSRAETADVSDRAPPPPPVVSSPPSGELKTYDVSSSVEPRRPGVFNERNQPPAGLLTAGDHDELLNPLLYARYVRDAAQGLGQSIRALPVLDTRNVLTVEVQDSSGRSAPFVPVTVKCADGSTLTLISHANGKVVFFPALDRLGDSVVIEAAGAGRRIDLGSGAGGQEQRLVIGGAAQAVRKLDLMIALDVTGSMGDEIAFLQSELRSILDSVRASHPGLDLRVGLVAYRDIGDDFVTSTYPLTGNFDRIQAALAMQRGRGGGDTPEAMDQALNRAVNQQWRPDAVKSLLLVGDAPPHDDNVARTFAVAEAARARRIHIVPVAASGVDDSAEYLMRAMAAATQSRYVFLTDDSGIGNGHAEPAVDCYVVTQLSSAIRRVLEGQLSGERIEPFPGEVIRTSGHYDHGRCVIPKDWQVD